MKTKPKAFWRFFLKRWIILAVVFTIIALLSDRIYYNFITVTRDYECTLDFQQTADNIQSLFHNADPDDLDDVLFANKVKISLAVLGDHVSHEPFGIETALVLADGQGNIKYTSEETAFASCYDYASHNMIYYTCEDNSLVDFAHEHYDPDSCLIINVGDIYVKGGTFLAGDTVALYDNDIEKPAAPKQNFAPADTEGYTHLIDDRERFGITCDVMGTRSDSELMKLLISYVSEVNNADFHSLGAFLPNGVIRTASSEGIEVNGKYYTLYELRTQDFYAVYGTNFIIFYVVLFGLSVIIALICAAVPYIKYRTRYNNEQYRRTMTDTMAHDLKSPLTAISGYAENLMEGINTDKREHYAAAILDNVHYMNDIITNVLELSKLEGKSAAIKKEKLDISELTTELYKKYELQSAEKNITTEIKGHCIITADKQMMAKALDNLLSNAVKYTKANGRISVNAGDSQFTVSNDSAETLKIPVTQLTEPFIKGDSSRSNKLGSGLGLSIVKNILDLHGYSMRISAEKGIFTVKIIFK